MAQANCLTHIERYTKLKVEFQLGLGMIRLNLDHLLKRYNQKLETVNSDRCRDVFPHPRQYESVAVESAKQLYDRLQRLH